MEERCHSIVEKGVLPDRRGCPGISTAKGREVQSDLDNTELIATLVRAISGAGADAGSEHADDYMREREEVETVPSDKCLEKEEGNVVLAGEGCGESGNEFCSRQEILQHVCKVMKLVK